ncbi:zf-HC2 domain-containing protein, partial [Streptomyces sp. SM14]|uniref:zf-HC2 domain-containing protein n=1 Tax=Streptomyces sp. SM14 TaxID=1736045 RepID=UPI0027E584A9
RPEPDSPEQHDGPGKPGGHDGSQHGYSHHALMSLLGVWALGACGATEAAAVEHHLNSCSACAEEGLRLRDAVSLLEPQRTLDLDGSLRPRVLESCLARRPARLPVPEWAAPFEAETARLDYLLHDLMDDEWHEPVRLRWYSGDSPVGCATTVAGVLDHLVAVDGLLCPGLGLPDPLGAEDDGGGPANRTDLHWLRTAADRERRPHGAWRPWRDQSRALVASAARLPHEAGRRVPYLTPERFCEGALSLEDAFLDRAFACWIHGEDIAEAVHYPYGAPPGPQLRMLVDLTARRVPVSLAGRRRAGLTSSPAALAPADAPGRTLHLEVEGEGGGDWFIPLDSPTAPASPDAAVAHVVLDDVAFCQLAAGRITLDQAAAGAAGDQRAVQDMLYATAALSRL